MLTSNYEFMTPTKHCRAKLANVFQRHGCTVDTSFQSCPLMIVTVPDREAYGLIAAIKKKKTLPEDLKTFIVEGLECQIYGLGEIS